MTNKWKIYLNKNQHLIDYVISNDFSWIDMEKCFTDLYKNHSKKVELFDENIVIYEGLEKIKMSKIYERSKLLRNKAIDSFKEKDGSIFCKCCSFNFDLFYWASAAKNYIEIHHKIPIYQYGWGDIQKTLKKALDNLVPLCANCHRMVHRERTTRPLDYILKAIKDNWITVKKYGKSK